MKIKSFEFKYLRTGWHLIKSDFSAFNLLVGVSGVGKTKILDSLLRVCKTASANAVNFSEGAEWDFMFEHEGHLYRWEAKVAPADFQHGRISGDEDDGDDNDGDDNSKEDGKAAFFTYEKVTRDSDIVLIERKENSFQYEGKELPKIKNTESALNVFAANDPVSSIRAGLRKIIKIGHSVQHLYVLAEPGYYEKLEAKHKQSVVDDIKSLRTDFTTKLYLLQKLHPAEYLNIKESFCEIFDSIEDLRVLKSGDPAVLSDCPPPPKHGDVYYLGIKERGIENWISPANMSSGMFRSLMIACQLSISPKGTVVIVDEIENSLGLNCIHKVAALMLGKAPEYQFIISSHHPYVINKIPISTWKLVSRAGYEVKITDAAQIGGFQTHSHYDAFTKLINAREYKQGIQ